MSEVIYIVRAYSDNGMSYSDRAYERLGSAYNLVNKLAKHCERVIVLRNGVKIHEVDTRFKATAFDH